MTAEGLAGQRSFREQLNSF